MRKCDGTQTLFNYIQTSLHPSESFNVIQQGTQTVIEF